MAMRILDFTLSWFTTVFTDTSEAWLSTRLRSLFVHALLSSTRPCRRSCNVETFLFVELVDVTSPVVDCVRWRGVHSSTVLFDRLDCSTGLEVTLDADFCLRIAVGWITFLGARAYVVVDFDFASSSELVLSFGFFERNGMRVGVFGTVRASRTLEGMMMGSTLIGGKESPWGWCAKLPGSVYKGMIKQMFLFPLFPPPSKFLPDPFFFEQAWKVPIWMELSCSPLPFVSRVPHDSRPLQVDLSCILTLYWCCVYWMTLFGSSIRLPSMNSPRWWVSEDVAERVCWSCVILLLM